MHPTHTCMQCRCVSLGDVWETVLSYEIFDRIAGRTQVPLAALCDKVKPSMLNHLSDEVFLF